MKALDPVLVIDGSRSMSVITYPRDTNDLQVSLIFMKTMDHFGGGTKTMNIDIPSTSLIDPCKGVAKLIITLIQAQMTK